MSDYCIDKFKRDSKGHQPSLRQHFVHHQSRGQKTCSIEKLRCILLCVIAALSLFSVMAYLVVCAINPTLEPPQKLPLDNRKTNQFSELTIQNLASGNFQDSFEKAAADHIFCRDKILQINASVQRVAIRTSNLLFNYPAFSTYYGSNCVEMPQVNRIQKKPSAQSEDKSKRMEDNANALNTLVSKIDGNLIYYQCSRIDTSSYSLVSKLVNKMADEKYVQQAFADKLDSRWQFVSGGYNASKDYDQDFFRLDHHWKISGATKAYKRIMQLLDKEAVQFSEPQSTGWPMWQGSFARLGIDFCLEGEQLEDVEYARSTLDVTVDGEKVDETFLDKGYAGSKSSAYIPQENYQDFYDSYFHKRAGIITMENTTLKNDETLLVLADSFSSCMDRFFAESYGRVVVIDPRKFSGSLSDVISKYNPKDCVCIFSDQTIWDLDNGVSEALGS